MATRVLGTGAWARNSSNPVLTFEDPHVASSFSSSDSDSEDDGNSAAIEHLQKSMFGAYSAGKDVEDNLFSAGLERINGLLIAAKSGAIACLICLEKVRISDPVWDCKGGCYAVLHLICIQSWARQSSFASLEQSQRLSANDLSIETSYWHCPKCRKDYLHTEIPRDYRCFCTKVVNPAPDPWLTPHTCGETCNRPLEGGCKHVCTLLCHPGPCPPCPQLVKLICFCGAQSQTRRCGQQSFSCGGVCNRQLECHLHRCSQQCHTGPCKPCPKKGLHSCRCQQVSEVRLCRDADFQCDKVCNKALNCGRHWCIEKCHSGPCRSCELQDKRTCPCGKVEYKGTTCDVKVPTCGLTCDKPLQCSLHKCLERCHWGPCVDTCRILLTKSCRCGSTKKEVPCFQELVCERKCQRIRNCARHACKRRCCAGDCPLCTEVCGRKLRCGNHKCPSPCHRGPCAPCPLTVQLKCACGGTILNVPCGSDRDMRPPRCPKPCLVSPTCHHGTKCKPHRCHYGGCPPCQLVCDTELLCGHKCKVKCHGPRPPPNPEYSAKRRKGVVNSVPRGGSPCPPCSEIVQLQCLGRHNGREKMVQCSQRSVFSCGNPCGNVLACGNHICTMLCHAITIPRRLETTDSKELPLTNTHPGGVDTCMKCTYSCQKVRTPGCPHKCELPCHSGSCPPCEALIKKGCYCGSLTHVFKCNFFSTLSNEEQRKLLSCKGPCHRKMSHCAHLCAEICHLGPCPGECRKKVTVRCICQRRKCEMMCFQVQALYQSNQGNGKNLSKGSSFVGLLACDEECLRMQTIRTVKDEQELRERKNTNPKEKVDLSKAGKKQRKSRASDKNEQSKWKDLFIFATKWGFFFGFMVLLVFVVYYGITVLQNLSDWMNELDSKRPKKKLSF